jgi:iron complex outermembrane receptor protein
MIKKSVVFLLIIVNTCFAQTDSLEINNVVLPSFQLDAFQFKTEWIKSASNVELIDSSYLDQGHQLSPQTSLNSMPGVRFESRGIDGSRRISIRGSSLRSPFGVRNIKMYWNGIPITSPDGSTGMEIFDVLLINNIEVVRGPGANIYGAGMGGVLLMKSTPTQKSISYSSTIGSRGTHKESVMFNYKTNKWKVKLGVINSYTEGYRAQEYNNKQQLFLAGSYMITKNQEVNIFFNTYKGEWGLPGALDSLQITENPQQAVKYAKDNNTRVERKRLRIGLGHTLNLKALEISNSFYWNTTVKENPYGTSLFFNGFKQEEGNGIGGRSTIHWKKQINQLQLGIVLGGEYQFDENLVDEYKLKDAQKQELKNSINTSAISYLGFLDTRINYKGWLLTVGASYNQLTYKRLNNSANLKEESNAFEPILVPRIGLLKNISSSVSFLTSYFKGYSPPTVWDLGVTDTLLNSVLQPEIGENIELGIKFKHKEKIKSSITFFQLNTKNAIVSKQLSNSNFEFTNAGFTQQVGIEYLIQSNFKFKEWKFWNSFAYTFSNYKFKEYEDGGNDYSSNYFSGIPNHRIVTNASITSPYGVYLTGNLTYEGEVYLDNGNTSTTPNYYIVSSKLGFEKKVGKKLSLDIYAFGENLTNTIYSSFLQLNGFSGKFYNPSATRSFYGGITLTLQL